MAIHMLFVEENWNGPMTPLACSAEELYEAYLHLDRALDEIVRLPQHLEISYARHITQYVTHNK